MKKGNFVLLTFLFLLMPFSLFADIEDNDNCSQAELISAMHNKAEINYSTSVTGTVQNSDDDYYYFTVTRSGTIEINYTSTNSTDLRIQAGVTCSSTITRVMANNTQYNDTLNVSAGQTVYIRIQRISGSPNYTLNLNFTADFSTSNTRDFTLVSGFPYNIKGDIQIIGNSVTLKADTMDCAPIGTNNNGFKIAYADKDSNAATFNSTSADITLPKGVTKIKYAGLYWQGRTQTPTIMAQGTTTKIRFPHDSNYQTVTTDSSKFNWYTETGITDSSTGKLYSYQGVANVTSLLQADINKVSSSIINSTGYSASIWVADVVTEVGMLASLNGYGAWSLVIVYEDSAGTLKNISTYDGFRLLKVKPSQNNINETLTQTLSGFYTPPSGAVNSKFLLFGGEGDAGDDPRANSGYNDNASLSNKTGTDVLLGTDVFNGTETDINGNNITTRNPACANTIGIDIHTYDVGTSSSKYPIIGNSQTSTTIKLTPATNEDSYLPGVFAFSTDIYTPKLCYVENIFRGNENISGQNVQVNADENLTVRVYVTNTDNAAAQKVQILHQFDSSFPYVNNSTNYNNLNPTYQTVMPPSYARTTATDIKGDDLFEYNSTSFVAKINLGTGATSSSGGTFSDNNKTTAVFEYKATVKSSQNYKTTYQVAYVNSALNIDYSNNPVEISSCDGTANSFFGYSFSKQGNVDAVDNISNGYTAAMGLQTKIANKSNYTVDAIWLGSGTTPTNYIGAPQGGGLPVTISLSDNTCSSDESLSVTGGPVEAIIPKGDYKGTSSTFTISNKAKKNAKLRFRFIDWSNLTTSKAINCFKSSTFSSLEKVPACFASDVKIEDAFGIEIANQCTTSGARPACQTSSYNAGKLPSPPYDNIYGCFNCLADALNGAQCSTDNFAIRPNDFNSTITVNQQFIADQNTSVTFYANQYNGTGTTDYNETMNNSFKVDVNISDTTKVCTAPSILFSPAVTFTNGVVTGTYSLPNVGDFNMTIHEINGSEYALVDADDTLDDAQRLISPFTRQIKVVPNSFTIDGNFTNGGNGFTYLSNFETYPNPADRNISALLDLNISARSATNAILSNYTSLCYAKDANLTINTATVGNTLTGLNKLLWYDRLHDLNGSIALANISSYTMPLDNTQFDSTDTNGTAQVQYLVNFDRNMTRTVQPFIFRINDVNTSNQDNRIGTKAFTDQNATFYYGRVYSTDYRGTSPINTTIRYEVYCNECIKANFNITGLQSPTSFYWYQNPLHTNTTFGNVFQFTKMGTTNIANPNLSTINANGFDTSHILTNATAPYTDRIHMRPSSWLIYNPFTSSATTNDFNVEFINSGNWAGQGDLGKTVDVNASTRTNRRMEW